MRVAKGWTGCENTAISVPRALPLRASRPQNLARTCAQACHCRGGQWVSCLDRKSTRLRGCWNKNRRRFQHLAFSEPGGLSAQPHAAWQCRASEEEVSSIESVLKPKLEWQGFSPSMLRRPNLYGGRRSERTNLAPVKLSSSCRSMSEPTHTYSTALQDQSVSGREPQKVSARSISLRV